VFKIDIATGVRTTVFEFTGDLVSNKGFAPRAGLVSDGAGSLLGTTITGGTAQNGTVFKVKVNTGELTTLLSFVGGGAKNRGINPLGGLVDDGAGVLWGATAYGGAYGRENSFGTLFKVNPSSGVLTTVVDFTGNGASNKGSLPYGGLVSGGAGVLWGTTAAGGANDKGTVFKVNASSEVLTTLVDFTGNGISNKGSGPAAALVSDGAGFFWGTTGYGGANNLGTVFKVNASTGELTTLVEFTGNGASNKGSGPFGALVSDGAGFFWGTTSGTNADGDANNLGTVFKVNASTGELTTLVEFTGNGASNKGSAPYGGLVSDGAGFFWGTTNGGGANDLGTVFKVNASTGELTSERWRGGDARGATSTSAPRNWRGWRSCCAKSGARSRSPAICAGRASWRSATRRSTGTSGATGRQAGRCTCTCAERARTAANATDATTAGADWPANA
jgi:uncharacterized repeat protein (TIGR03803 family)